MRPVFLPSKVRTVPAITPHRPTSTPTTPRLSVVIVNYNSWPDVSELAATLSATAEVASGTVEVVVVDNASDGPLPSSLSPSPSGVRVLLREDNGGFASGVNAGMRESRSPWLLLLNPDVVVAMDFLARILGRMDVLEGRREGRPGIVGFALKNPDGSPQPSVGTEPGLLRSLMGQFIPRSRRKYQAGWRVKPGPVPWVTGACMLIDGSLLRTLGGMDEDFFLYYEEVALCMAVRQAGRLVEYGRQPVDRPPPPAPESAALREDERDRPALEAPLLSQAFAAMAVPHAGVFDRSRRGLPRKYGVSTE